MLLPRYAAPMVWWLVDDPVAMVRVADTLLRYRHMPAEGVAVLSGSGGGNGVMVDRIIGMGLPLARLSQSTRAALSELLLPPQADNPVDLGGRQPTAPDDIAEPALRTLAADPDVGVVLLYMSTMPFFAAHALRTLAQAALASGKPTLAVMVPGPAADEPRAVLRELGLPYFDSLEDLLAALRGLFDYHRAAPLNAPMRPADLPTSLPSLKDLPQLVASDGIAVPRVIACATAEQAVAAAGMIGFPVVLKGHVEGITHKSELKAVKLGLTESAAVSVAWLDIAASVAADDLSKAFRGCIVQEQITPGTELLLSIRNDPQFGPIVLVGAGGTLVEASAPTPRAAPAPVSRETALRMLRGLRVSRSCSTPGAATQRAMSRRSPTRLCGWSWLAGPIWVIA